MKRSLSNLISRLTHHRRGPKPAPRARRARLGVEALEGRWCPAFVAAAALSPLHSSPATAAASNAMPSRSYLVQSQSQLVVYGNFGPNQDFYIKQNDDEYSIEVTINGVTKPYDSRYVHSLAVNLHGSSDSFRWDVSGDVGLVWLKRATINLGDGTNDVELNIGHDDVTSLKSSDITVNGGTGNDTVRADFCFVDGGTYSFTANLGSGFNDASVDLPRYVTGGAKVRVELNGGNGGNHFVTNNSSVFGAYISAGSSLELVQNGGGGNTYDYLAVEYHGWVDGDLVVRMDGRGGENTVQADLNIWSDSSQSSAGRVDAILRGGLGDEIDLDVDISPGADVTIVNAAVEYFGFANSSSRLTV